MRARPVAFFSLLVPFFLLLGATPARAAVSILAPADGAVFAAEDCPNAPCAAFVDFDAEVTGAPVDRVDLIVTPAGGGQAIVQPLCLPPDPVEGTPGCPAPPVILSEPDFQLVVGEWDVFVRAVRGGVNDDSPTIRVTVVEFNALLEIEILSPSDGAVFIAEPCPVAPCDAPVSFDVSVPNGEPDSVVLVATLDPFPPVPNVLCSPPDPIEGTPGCPPTPVVLHATAIRLRVGTWTVVARGTEGSTVRESEPIQVVVTPPNLPNVGPVALSSVTPLEAAPQLELRSPDLFFPDGLDTMPDVVRIHGTNLRENIFLQVFVAPIPFGEPDVGAAGQLPAGNWCLHAAEIVGRGIDPANNQEFLDVRLPKLPLEAETACGVGTGAFGSIFQKSWRWVIRDPFFRADREHEWWAIPSPRPAPWADAPPFEMVEPPYPQIHGFGFENKATDPRYEEFLTVFGNNAYLCVGIGAACITRIPDPIYHLLWWPVYRLVLGSTEGSCNGMAATSLLMNRGELIPEGYIPSVHHAAGFREAGDPANYTNTNFCTPFCSPPKPNDLWAEIRMNHGVQISKEFLFELLEVVGEALFDPNDVGSVRGVPNLTLERVTDDPLGHVMCFFEPGNGHCVTPYDVVDGSRILVYDNNAPFDENDPLESHRFIDIVGGDYDYPKRTNPPNNGNAIVAFPIDIWEDDRNLLGLEELAALVSGDVVKFLFLVAVGSADMTVTNDTGGHWGFEDDGSFTDELLGALAVPPLGPQPSPSRAMPLLLAMNQPEPNVQINADGGPYMFHTGSGGHLLQLEASHALAGDRDQIALGYQGGELASFDFSPERDADAIVPRVALAIDDEESALFHWVGLEVPAGTRVGFDASRDTRSVSFRNDTGAPSHPVLLLDHGSGSTETYGRMIYGPFEVPDGATHRVVANDWPQVGTLVSELDFDRDGVADHSEVVVGHAAMPPLAQDRSADLAVAKAASHDVATLEDVVAYQVEVTNAGPDPATQVSLVDALGDGAEVLEVVASQGTCTIGDTGVRCDLGDLAAGAGAAVQYTAVPLRPGSVANAATVFGDEGDPDLGNNTATTRTRVPMRIDVRPFSPHNQIRVGSHALVPVLILGEPGFDVRDIEHASLAFGPGGAPAHWLRLVFDLNRDGEDDLLNLYRIRQTGIEYGDTEACVTAMLADGGRVEGCDEIRTVPW